MPGVRIRLSADEANAALARFRTNLDSTGVTAKKTEKEIKTLEQRMLSNAGAVKQKRAFEDMAKMMGLTQREAQKLGKELGGIGGGVGGGSIAEMTGGVKGLGMAFMKVSLAIAGAAMSFRAFVLPSLTYLGKMETATLGIGTSLMMNNSYIDKNTKQVLQGTQALDAAIGHSEKVMNDLRIANLETTATLEQLVDAFQVTLPVAMAKGFNVKQAEDFTVAMVKAAGAIGLPFEQLGEETRSLLTENINPRNSRIATVLGLRNEDVRKYKDDAEGLYQFLMEKLQVYEVAGARSAKTWAGLWSNLKDIIQQVLGQAFEPLFIEVKRWLTDTTSGLFKVVKVTNELGEETKKIEWNKDLVKGVNAFRDALETTIGWAHKLQMILSGMGEIVSNLMSGVWALSETFWQIYNIPFFGTSDLGNAGLKAARSARVESQENAKRYRQARVEGEKYFADKAMGKQNFSPISDEEALTLFDYGAKPDGTMTSEIDPSKKWYYRTNPPPSKTNAVPNPKKPGGDEEGGGGGANEGHRLEDLRTKLREDMEKMGKDEAGLLDLETQKILADLAPKGKKGVRGKVSAQDEILVAEWKKAKLTEINDKEEKAFQDNLQKRSEEIQKEYEEEVTLRQGLADEEFRIAQDLEQSQVDLDVEKRILTERDAFIKKQDAAVKANQQEQDALITKMNSLPVDDERLKKMTQELILLDAKGKALQKTNKIDLESYDIKKKKELQDKVGYLDLSYAKQKQTELYDDIAKMKKDGIETSRYEAEQLKQIEISKYEAILDSTDDFSEAMDAKWKLIGLQAKSAVKVWADAFEGAIQQIKSSLSDFFNDLFNSESKSVSEYAQSFARGLSREMSNALSENIVNSFTSNGDGESSGLLGWVGKIFGIGGGSSTSKSKDFSGATKQATDKLDKFSEALEKATKNIGSSLGSGNGSIENGLFNFGGGGGSSGSTNYGDDNIAGQLDSSSSAYNPDYVTWTQSVDKYSDILTNTSKSDVLQEGETLDVGWWDKTKAWGKNQIENQFGTRIFSNADEEGIFGGSGRSAAQGPGQHDAQKEWNSTLDQRRYQRAGDTMSNNSAQNIFGMGDFGNTVEDTTTTLGSFDESCNSLSDGFGDLGSISDSLMGSFSDLDSGFSDLSGYLEGITNGSDGDVQSFGSGGGGLLDSLLGTVIGGGYSGSGGYSSMSQGGMEGMSLSDFPASARGNIFKNGKILPFRKGGVVSNLTYFPMANGGIGSIAEENDPEAIMPLARNSRGQLGIHGGNSSTTISVPVNITGNISKQDTLASDLRTEIENTVLRVIKGHI